MNQIFNSDYTFQSQYAGFRATKIYPKLAHCFEVLESFSDFDELKDDYADVPYADKAGVDAVLTFASGIDKHTLAPLRENHRRIVKLQVKTIRADKTAKFGHNLTLAQVDVPKLQNVDLYVMIFEREGQEPDYVVYDVPALRTFIAQNLHTINQNFTRTQNRHSNDTFMWLPIYPIEYRDKITYAINKFGLPVSLAMACSDGVWHMLTCARFGVTELKIARSGQ